MKFIRKILLVFLLFVLFVPLIYYFESKFKDSSEKINMDIIKEEITEKTYKEDETDDIKEIKITAIGDIFMHESVIKSGIQTDNSYNYDYIFKDTLSYFSDSDISSLYQGSVIAGDEYGVSGYPDFNAPVSICSAIEKAGFNIALMANNRVNSLGSEGIINTLNNWDKLTDNVLVLGINQNESQFNALKVIEVKGIKIALLNYTKDVTNPIDQNKKYLVDILEMEKVINDIKKAEEEADFTIIFPYWGTEYVFEPDQNQKEIAMKMTEAGADLIIGSRPHFLQNIEKINVNDKNSLCFYSLGNFISSQNYTGAMLGGIANIILKIDENGINIDYDKTGIIPVVTHYTYDETNDVVKVFGVYPFKNYTDELALNHGIIKRAGLEFSRDILNNILDKYIDSNFILER